MITLRRGPNGTFQITTGLMLLLGQLEEHGQAQICDESTGATYHLHDVGGRLVALSEQSQANVQALANAVIHRARSH